MATSPTKGRTLVRPAIAADADAVFLLLRQLEEGYAPDRTAFDESFASFLTDGDATLVLVATDEADAVLGYAMTTISRLLHTNGSAGQLQELVVDENARGTGVGSQLLETTESVCRERHVRQLTVASRRSAAFYERLGYRSTADYLKRTFD